MNNEFKKKNSFDKRSKESSDINKKFPGRVPVIVEKYYQNELPEIDKVKYLVPKDMTMAKFIFIIRKRINLEPSQSLFIMINNSMVVGSRFISDVYDDMKDEDGVVYVTYTSENTCG